jgi:ATP-binding protein involved in chromosome partitioning
MLVNLALALSQLGAKVGILDADIFGPSIPTLLKLSGEPRLSSEGKLLPLSNYGVESMSMGYLIKPETPVVWRGLMVMKAMQQLLFEVKWSALDYLVIDMPPGTGDTQLSISQQVKVHGAVIVSTPQDIALIDAVKGISMFEKVNIPILGMVQNMSYYVCPNCNHEAHIFGDGGTAKEADKRGLKLLGSIPLNEEICLQSDIGKPPVLSSDNEAIKSAYLNIGKNVIQALD